MSDSDQARENRVIQGFQKTLNTHGYGFQYAVVRHVVERYKPRGFGWALEATEFPVEVRGHETRIDFILGRREEINTKASPLYYMVAECKRANPALSNWCFIGAPYTKDDRYVILERVMLTEHNRIIAMAVEQFMGTKGYHVALEVRSDQAGDEVRSGRNAIEEAVSQVLRGVNGMCEFLGGHTHFFTAIGRPITLVPVIFTTAKLWASDASLGDADLSSGNTDLSGSGFKQTPWLLYQYNSSPGLKHAQPLMEKSPWQNTLKGIMEQDYLRTVAVVNAEGIDDFLTWSQSLMVGV